MNNPTNRPESASAQFVEFLGALFWLFFLGLIIVVWLFWMVSTAAPLGITQRFSAIAQPSIMGLSREKKSDQSRPKQRIYYIGGICRSFQEQKQTAEQIAQIIDQPVITLNTGSWDEPHSGLRRLLFRVQRDPLSLENRCDAPFLEQLENLRVFVAWHTPLKGRYGQIAGLLKELLRWDAQHGYTSVIYTYSAGNLLLKQLFPSNRSAPLWLPEEAQLKVFAIASPVTEGQLEIPQGELYFLTNPADPIRCYQNDAGIRAARHCYQQQVVRDTSPENPYGDNAHQVEFYIQKYYDQLFGDLLPAEAKAPAESSSQKH